MRIDGRRLLAIATSLTALLAVAVCTPVASAVAGGTPDTSACATYEAQAHPVQYAYVVLTPVPGLPNTADAVLCLRGASFENGQTPGVYISTPKSASTTVQVVATSPAPTTTTAVANQVTVSWDPASAGGTWRGAVRFQVNDTPGKSVEAALTAFGGMTFTDPDSDTNYLVTTELTAAGGCDVGADQLPTTPDRTVHPTVGTTEGDTLEATAPGSSIATWNLLSQTFGTGSWKFEWNRDGTFALDPPQVARVKFRYTVTAANGCTSAPATVTIVPSPAKALLSATADTTHSPTPATLRASVPAGITAGPHTTYTFGFGDHTAAVKSSKPTLRHSYAKNGTYTASVKVWVNAKHIYTTSVPVKIGAAANKSTARTAAAPSSLGVGTVHVTILSANVTANHNARIHTDCLIKVKSRVQEIRKSGITALKQRGYLHGIYSRHGLPSYQSTDYFQSPRFPNDDQSFYFESTTWFFVDAGRWKVQIKGVGVKDNASDPSTSADTGELDCDAEG
jgi:PKD domain